MNKLTIEQVAKFPRPGMSGVPSRIGFTPDSHSVTYLAAEGNSLVLQLWAYDIDSGTRRKLIEPTSQAEDAGQLSLDEQLRRERARMREVGVTNYEFAAKSEKPVLLVPMSGKLYVKIGDEPLQELEGTDGAVDARLSPDGTQVAFVRNGNLCVMPLPVGPIFEVTSDGDESKGFTYGLAEYVAQEEMGRSHGFWWSPDSQRIAYEKVESEHIPEYLISHWGGENVNVEKHRYPFAGAANAHVSLEVAYVSEDDTARAHSYGSEVDKDFLQLVTDDNPDIYLARVFWRPNNTLVALVETRDQKTVRLVTFDEVTMQTETLLEEHNDTWINLNNDITFLKTGEFIWASESSGFKHFYLSDQNGGLICQLTSGDWLVTEVVGVDEDSHIVYFIATKESVLERHLYAVSLDGGDVKKLTENAGWHSVVFSPDFKYFVDTFNNLETAPRVALHNNDGSLIATLFENTGNTAQELGLTPPELFSFKNREGTELFGAVYLPPQLNPDQKYPLIVTVYGGPHAQRVMNHWNLTVDLRAQYLAQQGFVVLCVDNRGSANRGLLFEGAISRLTGFAEVDDQVDGVNYLAANRPYVDKNRAGVYGWSYGGYMTLMCLLRAPETFKVGVAGAPVTDWRGYDTHYTERYMGTPENNLEGYDKSSVLSYVEQLQGHLLLIHGMVDENVHFRHTARLIQALTAAQKTYDLVIYPEERHMPRDAKGLEYQERRLVDYFTKHL